MKNINTYIIEKLKVNKSSKAYNFHPKTKDELIKIIRKLINERGKNADLNDINIKGITDLSKVFDGMRNIVDIDISGWDVSNVTNMDCMFFHCNNFTGKSIENWDVSKLETAVEMFSLCDQFNADLGNWNLKSLKNAEGMFSNTTKFTGKGLEKWKLPEIQNIISIFNGARSFNNEGIENWNINDSVLQDDAFISNDDLKNKPTWYHEINF